MSKLFSLSEDQLRQLVKKAVKDNLQSEGFKDWLQGKQTKTTGGKFFKGKGSAAAGEETSYGMKQPGSATRSAIGGQGRGRYQVDHREIIKTVEQLRPAMTAAGIPNGVVEDVVRQLTNPEGEGDLKGLAKKATQEKSAWIGQGDDVIADIWQDVRCMAFAKLHTEYGAANAAMQRQCADHFRSIREEPPVVDPPPGEDEDEVVDDQPEQDDSPVPIFKDMTGPEGKKLGAKAGGQGLQGLLQNWINKNAPQGVDPKALQKAIRQIVTDVADQLKANKIPVQEAKQYIKEELINILVEQKRLIERRYDKDGDAETVKALVQQLQLQPGDIKHVKKVKGLVKKPSLIAVNKSGVGRIYSVDSRPDTEGESGGKEQAEKWASEGEGETPGEEPGPAKEISGDIVLDALKSRLKELDLDSNDGMQAALKDDQAYLGAYMFYKVMNKILKALEKNPKASAKELIALAPKELGGTETGAGSPYSPKRTGAIKEGLILEQVEAIMEEAANVYLIKMLEDIGVLNEQQYTHQTTPAIIQWLKEKIKFFKMRGLDDGARAVKASKAARGAPGGDITDPQPGETPEDVVKRVADAVKAGKASKNDLAKAQQKAKAAADETARGGKEGELNTMQSVAPRLKQAGIDINSPEGKALTKNLLRLIRRFTNRHFGRLKIDMAKGGKEAAAGQKDMQDKINLLKRRGQNKEAAALQHKMDQTVKTVTEEKMTEITLRILEAILSNKNLLNEAKKRALLETRGYSFANETDQDHSVVEKLAGNLYPYLKKQLKFDRDASIRLVSDPENGKNPLGKTAYYDPASYSVTIYADNRHPKDILRSFSHEMVHHSQNCQGNFDNAMVGEQGYAQKDSHLREMERQAYEVGNLAFRDWEDGMKAAMMERIQAKLAEKSQIVDQPNLKLALKEAINKDSLTKALFTG